MGEVFVRTDDFQLAYRLLASLKARKGRCRHVATDLPLPHSAKVWLASHEEVAKAADPLGIGADLESVDRAVDRALRRMNRVDMVQLMTFGIDPGPRPGLAWMGDGRLLGVEQLESVDRTIDRIAVLAEDHGAEGVLIRIGDGSPTISNRLVNVCLARGMHVERVDEHRTSEGLARHNHRSAAARIAQIEGEPVKTKLKVVPTEGEIREIQRRSRRHAAGRVTISRNLASAVAVGRMTMEEAVIAQMRRRAI